MPWRHCSSGQTGWLWGCCVDVERNLSFLPHRMSAIYVRNGRHNHFFAHFAMYGLYDPCSTVLYSTSWSPNLIELVLTTLDASLPAGAYFSASLV